MKKGQSIGYYFPLLFNMFVFIVFSACASAPSEVLEQIAESTRKSLPITCDENIMMVDCKVLPNRTLKFTYDIKGSYTEEQKKNVREAMKPVLMERLKERKEIEFYLVNNVRFEHLFLDSMNRTVVQVEIEAMDYK